MLIDGESFRLYKEEDLLRDDAYDSQHIKQKLNKVLCFLLANILDLFAPPRIKVIVDDKYIRNFITQL